MAAAIQSQLTFKVEVEFKHNWVNWYAEIEVVRTEDENHINHEFKIRNEILLPTLSDNDREELYEVAKDYVDELVSTREI